MSTKRRKPSAGWHKIPPACATEASDSPICARVQVRVSTLPEFISDDRGLATRAKCIFRGGATAHWWNDIRSAQGSADSEAQRGARGGAAPGRGNSLLDSMGKLGRDLPGCGRSGAAWTPESFTNRPPKHAREVLAIFSCSATRPAQPLALTPLDSVPPATANARDGVLHDHSALFEDDPISAPRMVDDPTSGGLAPFIEAFSTPE